MAVVAQIPLVAACADVATTTASVVSLAKVFGRPGVSKPHKPTAANLLDACRNLSRLIASLDFLPAELTQVRAVADPLKFKPLVHQFELKTSACETVSEIATSVLNHIGWVVHLQSFLTPCPSQWPDHATVDDFLDHWREMQLERFRDELTRLGDAASSLLLLVEQEAAKVTIALGANVPAAIPLPTTFQRPRKERALGRPRKVMANEGKRRRRLAEELANSTISLPKFAAARGIPKKELKAILRWVERNSSTAT